MGTQRLYLESGGFSSYLYDQDGATIFASNGVEGKVVYKIEGSKFDGLPILSNSSEVYLKKDKNGSIVQARIYKDRKPVCDFDWDHEHENNDGEKFPKGVVHVQSWLKDTNGNYTRDTKHARYMSNAEMERYGELIKLANPNAKLRK